MKIEKVIISLFCTFAILRYFNFPFSVTLLTIVDMIACLYYILMGVLLFNNIKLQDAFERSNYFNIGVSEIVISILSGIGIGIIMISLLFMLNKWNYYASVMILFTGMLLIVPCIGFSAFLWINKRHPTYKRILWRLIPVTMISVLFQWLF